MPPTWGWGHGTQPWVGIGCRHDGCMDKGVDAAPALRALLLLSSAFSLLLDKMPPT